jgi:type IV pilus assembly protein PilW
MSQYKKIGNGSAMRGFSLIEVMVAIALSLIAILVIGQVFSISEARKRVTGGAAEATQIASVNLYQIGRLMRLGGSGLTQGVNVWGCTLQAGRGGTSIVPPSALPAPFATVPTTVRIVPTIIHAGKGNGGSDVVAIFAGDGDPGQYQFDFASNPVGTNIEVINSNGFRRRDLLLGVQTSSVGNCSIVQVDDSYPLASAQYQANTASRPATTEQLLSVGSTGTPPYNGTYSFAGNYSIGDIFINLGQRPKFLMFGLNDRNQLFEYDFLNLDGAATNNGRIIAENVVDLRAIYGIDTGADTDGDGTLTPTEWVAPNAAPYDVATLNSATAAATWDKMTAVRVAMVVRSAEPARDDQNPPASYTIFPGTAREAAVTIPAALRAFRHQVYETTIPVRNNKFVPKDRTR